MNEQDNNLIFGLDIGTRTVVGVVGYKREKNFEVIAMDIEEHDSRAMVDGQIHDISEVAKAVRRVKERLEAKIGCELKEVAIAAAGRSLKTYSVKAENEIDTIKITNKHIRMLEIDGVTLAEEKLKQELNDNDLEYFCVAHTVVNYYLDGYVITNLEGHRGKLISAVVLATFLPKSVVDSLYAVVNRVGLNVTTLTLEPIAAINVVIPEKLRLLNLCLLDVGAGTSDIAITRDGSITAYGMIPIAGDEITEQLIHHYLVDFSTAEKMKIDCSKEENITFADIFATIITVPKGEILKLLEPTIQELADKVANKIVELNAGKAPNAVFCVGGGGQVPGFTKKLAKFLALQDDRVVLKSSKSIDNIEYKSDYLEGTNIVTPIGICVTSVQQKGYNFIEVKLNGETVRLLNSRKLKILDAGIVKEFNHENLIGRKGKDLKFILNGKPKKITGEMGEQAEILLNGKVADLETFIKEGDNIKIKPAKNGIDAKVVISDLIDSDDICYIMFNDHDVKVRSNVKINKMTVDASMRVEEDDEVVITKIKTVEDLCKQQGIQYESKSIYMNNKKIDIHHHIKEGDCIYIEDQTIENVKNQNIIEKGFTKSNNNAIIILNNELIELNLNKTPYMFVDLFNYIDIDTANKKGKLEMKLNKENVLLTDIIKDGDIADIKWVEDN
ncbi:MAG TPA: cell division protein FtsA [Clostridiales bacterium]|nr:MAG: hypothetical protein A2Y18_02070 [Clostridiales bacterium GWD2_32_19]HCC07492.1 cell division protein FtsA [Clostridiales bacterium]